MHFFFWMGKNQSNHIFTAKISFFWDISQVCASSHPCLDHEYLFSKIKENYVVKKSNRK